MYLHENALKPVRSKVRMFVNLTEYSPFIIHCQLDAAVRPKQTIQQTILWVMEKTRKINK